ncbi:MAG TPA: glutathione transferase GstA [Magnetospirillaceae bacterium]|jgi:glutathione S-transferase
MKYYYSTGSCSLSPRIALQEAGLTHDSEAVDLAAKKTKGGSDFWAINSKGYVPALVLDDGELLTENAVILQYIADKTPEKKLAPPAGGMERVRFQEWLIFITTELHKTFSPLFNPKSNDEFKETVVTRLKMRFGLITKQLGSKTYLFGDDFSVADGYLFTMLTWAKHKGVDVGPALTSYYDRVAARPAVQAALKAEGIIA